MSERKRYQMLIDGAWVDGEGGKTFDSVNPATGAVWAEIPEASEADVNRAVEAAHRAFLEGPWSKTTPSERGRTLRKLADLLAENSELLGRTETVDTGKMLKETRWQAKYIAEFFHFNAGLADKVVGETLPIDKPDLHVFTTREPLGVVAAIVPWNSQLFLVAVKLGPALAAGNTVVLKASEHASAAMLEFGKLVEQAGFPPGVVNIVTGFGEPCGRTLTSHPLVARVSFTGGPRTSPRSPSSWAASRPSWCSRTRTWRAPLTARWPAFSAPAASPASPAPGSTCRRASPTASSTTWSRALARSASAIPWPKRPRWVRSPPRAR